MDINFLKKSAVDYFNGESTPEQEALLSDFITSDDKHKEMFCEWEREWLGEHVPSRKTRDDWQKISLAVQRRMTDGCREENKSELGDRHCKRVSINKIYLAGAAASILILCVLGLKFLDVSIKQPHATNFTIETNNGEQSKLMLPDGTTVWLNASTTLSYDSDFNKKDRVMTLVGEAYFEVGKDPKRPFIVKTADCSFEVKGTRFNLTAYKDEETISAVLMEGAMLFDSPNDSQMLKIGHALTYNTVTGKVSNIPIRAEQYRSWIDGCFEYDKITMSELLGRLSRRYNVEIEYRSAQKDEPMFSVSLKNGETIDNVLNALSLIVPIESKREGNKVIIKMDEKKMEQMN